jgi:hypothetical protein
MLLVTETEWTHAGIVAAAIIPVALFWIDTRRQSAKMHAENSNRLTRIETILEPIWKWWNNGKS